MLVPYVIYVCDCYVCIKARESEAPSLAWSAARQLGRGTGRSPAAKTEELFSGSFGGCACPSTHVALPRKTF